MADDSNPTPAPINAPITAPITTAEQTAEQVRAEALAETTRIAAVRKVCARGGRRWRQAQRD